MLAMNGNTATYMQYAYARVRSIFAAEADRRRALRAAARAILLDSPAERALALEFLRFSEALDLAVADYRPNQLTAYLFDLANRYSTFFEQCPVLKADDGAARQPAAALRSDRPDDQAGLGAAGDRGRGEDVRKHDSRSATSRLASRDRCVGNRLAGRVRRRGARGA